MKQVLITLTILLSSSCFAQQSPTKESVDLKLEQAKKRISISERMKTDFPDKFSGNWSLGRTKSKMDDSKGFHGILKSVNAVKNKYGKEVKAELIARCKENKTEVYIATDMFIGTNTQEVRYRIDEKKPVSKNWQTSTDHKAIFVSKPIGLLRQLSKSKNFIFQTTPYGDSPKMFEFKTEGVQQVVREIQDTCSWS